MYEINWDDYLSTNRYRTSEKIQKDDLKDERDEFESDFGRVIFSSALRRMHDKAQVVPLTTGDNVHTRLTHSMEVMNIADSLGANLFRNKEYSNLYGNKSLNYIRKFSSILKTAGIVHDIGNPPFGHFGEKIIQNYFKENISKYDINEDQKLDFINFDGNAQGFRVLTKLQYLGDLSGLNLTYTTLAAYLKYPNIGKIEERIIASKKHGVFTSEKDIFNKIISNCKLDEKSEHAIIKRHPLSYLIEAADTISYAVMDIEDGFSLNCFSYSELLEELNFDSEIIHKLNLETIKVKSDIKEKKLVVDFRYKVIQYLVNLAIKNFINYSREIDYGRFQKELVNIDDFSIYKKIDNFSIKFLYNRQEVHKMELIGNSVINGLLDLLIKYVFNDDNKYRDRAKSIISDNIIKLIYHESKHKYDNSYFMDSQEYCKLDFKDLDDYSKLRMIVDFISGMTDKYAVRLYQNLSGQRLD